MSLSLEEYDPLADFEQVGPSQRQSADHVRAQDQSSANRGLDRVSTDSVWHVHEPPAIAANPAPPADSLTPLAELQPWPSGNEIEAQIIDEFYRSNFLRLLAQRVRSLQDAANHDLQSEVAHLRTENGRLRAQFAKNGMELPGSFPQPPPPTVPEKPSTQAETILSEAEQTRQATSKVSVGIERSLPANERSSMVSVQSHGPTVALQLKALNFGEGAEKDRSREIRNLARTATIQAKKSNAEAKARQLELAAGVKRSKTFDARDDNHMVPRQVFADSESMKQQVRAAIVRPPYHVSQYYKSKGWAAMFAKNIWFEYITFCIILVNAIWMAIDTDLNKQQAITDAAPIFQIAEYFFIAYFMLEWIIRYIAFANKWDCMKDSWFIFDSFLVLLMLIDTCAIISSVYLQSTKARAGDASILKLFRMLRITRTARMARLLKALPELTILVKGIFVAARSVFFTLCLLMMIIYVFAVAFTQITEDTAVGEFYFRSVGYSMKALLVYATLPDMADFVDDLGDEHVVLAALLLLFILLASLTVMNMLVGVLVEVVSVVSAVEKEELLVTFVKKKLLDMLRRSGLDADEDMMISRYEFEMLLVLPQAAKVIQDVGVDPVGLVDFADYIFQDSHDDKLTFSEFIDLVLELRGCKHSTVKDVVDLRKILIKQMEYIERALESNANRLDEITEIDEVREGLARRTSIAQGGKGSILAMRAVAQMKNSILAPDGQQDSPRGFFGVSPTDSRGVCTKVSEVSNLQ